MKKILALVLALTMAAAVLAGCSGQKAEGTTVGTTAGTTAATTAATTADTTAPAATGNSENTNDLGLVNTGILTVGTEASYQPFEFYAEDGTTIIGFDADLSAALAEKLGLDVQIIDTSFDTIFEGLGKNYDVAIAGITISPDREENALFSSPYITNYQAIVVKADSDLTFSALTDLSGHSVSMQKATASDILLGNLIDTGSVTNCVAVTNEKIPTSFEQLTNGEVDTVLCDSTVADCYVAKHPDLYKIAYEDDQEPETFGVAIDKGNPALQEAINKAMAELEDSGYMDEIRTKWFG